MLPNPKAGNYVGMFTDQNGSVGRFQLTIGTWSDVHGVFYTAINKYMNFDGSIDRDGVGALRYLNGTEYVDEVAGIQLGPIGQPTTTLNITPVNNKNPSAVAVLLVNPSGPYGNPNPFTGNYAGTILDTTINKAEVLAINVSGSGTVSGTEIIDNNGTPVATPISGTVSSTGWISYVLKANQVSIFGTIYGGNPVAGPVQLSTGDDATLSLSTVAALLFLPTPN